MEQSLNGFEFGVMLFLLAAGLTLVFGIIRFVNLAHGSFYMIGAFVAATAESITHSYFLALLIAVPVTAVVGFITERVVLRTLYGRGPLDQVMCTFGLIMFFKELVRIVWGNLPLSLSLPDLLAKSVELGPSFPYSIFRLMIIATGIVVAIGLHLLVNQTRIGMIMRGGASDRIMIQALGVNVDLLFVGVFAAGAALAALAGVLASPLFGVQVGMGDDILILTLVVIVIGGVGSIKGAFVGALLVGVVETFSQILLPATLSSISVYVLMATVLVSRPRGLFPAYD